MLETLSEVHAQVPVDCARSSVKVALASQTATWGIPLRLPVTPCRVACCGTTLNLTRSASAPHLVVLAGSGHGAHGRPGVRAFASKTSAEACRFPSASEPPAASTSPLWRGASSTCLRTQRMLEAKHAPAATEHAGDADVSRHVHSTDPAGERVAHNGSGQHR